MGILGGISISELQSYHALLQIIPEVPRPINISSYFQVRIAFVLVYFQHHWNIYIFRLRNNGSRQLFFDCLLYFGFVVSLNENHVETAKSFFSPLAFFNSSNFIHFIPYLKRYFALSGTFSENVLKNELLPWPDGFHGRCRRSISQVIDRSSREARTHFLDHSSYIP